MKRIKHLKKDYVQLENRNGYMVTYKPYTICNLPPKFGTDEVTDWFNYKGYTYIAEQIMSKWVDRIMDEVYDKFDRHLHEYDERMEFLSDLIRELEEALKEVKQELEELG